MTKTTPNFKIEDEYAPLIVAGTDEAGRGPLCGPVVAAAVIFAGHKKGECEVPFAGEGVARSAGEGLINDSKQLSQARREAAYDWITKNTIWAVGMCGAEEIDDINILWASMLAMERAINGLSTRPDFVLVDGNRVPKGLNGRAVVRGDTKSMSIAAASIVAKVTRDRIMTQLAEQFPQYGWERNAGYPTREHLAALAKYGATPHHRKTYAPVRAITGRA